MKSYKDYAEIVFQEKMVELDTGIKMAYYEFGMENSVPLLLIHGITDGCVSWTQMIPELTGRGYHLYIIEYRGNGMTDKPEADECGYTAEMIAGDIINWMDKTGIKQIHLTGHSYGSMISQVLEARYPERFLTCILMDTGVECKGDLITLEQLGLLHKKINSLVKKMGNELQNGVIERAPIKNSTHLNTCDYCDYSDICANTKAIYNKIGANLKDEQVIESLRKEFENDAGMDNTTE